MPSCEKTIFFILHRFFCHNWSLWFCNNYYHFLPSKKKLQLISKISYLPLNFFLKTNKSVISSLSEISQARFAQINNKDFSLSFEMTSSKVALT
jgi:hypothetical protein